jgi:hypothetical protein
MKRIMIVLALLIAVVACKQNEGTNGGGTQVTTEAGTADTVSFISPDEYLIVHIKADRPSENLAVAVGEWLDEALGGYYPGDVGDLQQMADFYGHAVCDTLKEIAKEVGPNMYLEYEVTMEKVWENDQVVTYTLQTFQGLGGAHPSSGFEGATFRKSDGRRLGWDIVSRRFRYELSELLVKNLKSYLEVETDEEMIELIGDDKFYGLPLPQTPPYMTDAGLVFIYQQYELLAYAYGMPTGTIAYETIKPLLTSQAQKLL